MSEAAKMDKPTRSAIIRATREIMVARFPLAFMPKGSPKIPLKIGIAHDVIAACKDIPKEHIDIFFGTYVGGYRYQQAIISGEHRFDLEGKIAGPITANQKDHARGIIRKHEMNSEEAKKVREAKKDAERRPATSGGGRAMAPIPNKIPF